MNGSENNMREIIGRDISALLNPRPLALIGASHAGIDNFATVAWITPVSHKPPMLVFALRRTSQTFKMIDITRCFSVCIPGKDLLETVVFCGNHTGATEDKMIPISYRLFNLGGEGVCAQGNEFQDDQEIPLASCVPVISLARSFLVCDVDTIQQTGDHMLVCAHVRKAFSQCATDDKNRACALDTLLVIQHDLFAVAEQLFDDEAEASALVKNTLG